MKASQKSNPVEGKQKEDSHIFEVQLSFLEHIKKVMQPHEKQFNIIDFFQFIINYCMKLPNQHFEAIVTQNLNENQFFSKEFCQATSSEEESLLLSHKKSFTQQKVRSKAISAQVKQRKLKYAEEILDQFKNVFLWYKKRSISYEMINNYVLSCQNRTLKYKNSLQTLKQYQNLPHRRVRLDQNVKLCIMPQGDSSKIKFLAINPSQQNTEDIFRKEVFVVTSQYVRGIHVDSQKLAKQGNKTVKVKEMDQIQQSSKINIVKNWYTYSEDKILPQNLVSNEKDMKINAKKQLYIEKVVISEHLIGMITHEKDVLIKPFLNQSEKYQRGRRVIPYQVRMGNLVTDVPDENLQRPLSKDKARAEQLEKSKILMFECYNDDIWLVVNEEFVYVYVLPLPDSKEHVNDEEQKSSLLSLCEPLPARAYQAKLLTKQYLAIMLQTPCVIILKLQLSSKRSHRQKNRIYPTNKIYNDIKYICMNYHPVEKQLLFTDFGSYLIRLKFNIADGDIERQGAVYDEQTGKFLTKNTTNTKRDQQFSILKKQSEINVQGSLMNHPSKDEVDQIVWKKTIEGKINIQSNRKSTLTVWQNKGTSMAEVGTTDIHLSNHKQLSNKKSQKSGKLSQKSADRGGMSIYSKPQNTDFTKIVKNSSRQNMILLCLNKNSSTLITYEEMSVNPIKNNKNESQPDNKDRLYDKTIKLWDINYMNVYQTFALSLQIEDMSLQSNGLYIVTKERGYLGFYPFINKQQQTSEESNPKSHNQLPIIQQFHPAIATLGQRILINGNEIFFCTQLSKQRNLSKIQQQGYQNHIINYNNSVTTIYSLSTSHQSHTIFNLEEIPAEITQFQVNEKLYVLSDTSGDKRYNTHIYDLLGNKEAMLRGVERTEKYGVLENYHNVRKIKHFQFNVLMWNKHSLKFIGSNLEESFTVHWTFNCQQRLSSNNVNGSEFDLRSLKSSVIKKEKSIEDICVSENSITVQEKLQNDLFKTVSVSVFNLDSARIKYRISDIRSSFKVLEMFNNMILAHENVDRKSMTSNEFDQLDTQRRFSHPRSVEFSNQSDSSCPVEEDQEFINLFDFNSPLNKKCVLTLKYKTMTEKNMTLSQIKQFQMSTNTAILHDRFFIQKHISLKSARIFALNNDNSIFVSCIFHVRFIQILKNFQHQTAIHKSKVLHITQKYFLYTREISSQISQKLNYIPHTNDANIKKVNKKVSFEYMGETQIHQRIVGHWEIDLDQLITRSTIKNFSYLADLHADTDQGIEFIVDNITEKILSFGEDEKHFQNKLQKHQSLVKIYEERSNHESNQKINISWILAEAQSPKSIICLNSSKSFQLFEQTIDFKIVKNLSVSLDKICNIAIDEQTNKPIIKEWNNDFNSENKIIWQETKSCMVKYIKQKLSKQTQKQLNSQTSIISRKTINESSEVNSSQMGLRETNQKNLKNQVVNDGQQQQESQQSRPQFSSNEINSMFRQWHINKNIEKEMKQYEKNTNETQKQLNKELKHIIENAQLKEERMKYLLAFPQKMKDPHNFNAIKLISKRVKSPTDLKDILADLNEKQDKQTMEIKKTLPIQQSQKNSRLQNSEQNLQNRVQNSLQKLSASISLPKILLTDQPKSLRSGLRTSKNAELKQTKNDHLSDQRFHSSLSSEYSFATPARVDGNSKGLKNLSNLPLTRTKTETSDRNYLQLIAETSFESPLESLKQRLLNEKFSKQQKQLIYSPNPESSLSNIQVKDIKNRLTTSNTPNHQNIIMKSPFAPGSNQIQSKKSKSVLTRAKTQLSQPSDDQVLMHVSKSALIQLKESSKTISKSVLPQIKINRQKLNEKMKQKKSFLKAINERLCFSKEDIKQQIFRKHKNLDYSERLRTIQ